ncbi:MAG TPA: glucokinase [Anaerolineales bacterium]|nr:glucokinase [Anaerolineales bacterium]
MLLSGDIGGTKTILALYTHEDGPRNPYAQFTYASTKYDSLEAMVLEFKNQTRVEIERATFAVAGPVLGGKAQITNLPWVMEESQLLEILGLNSVKLINDLVAVGYGVPELQPEELYTLQQGHPIPGGAIGVVAPGTGLGETYLVWDGKHYRAHPSEGGHTDFGPTTPLQFGLLRYLQEKFGHVSYERICSGIGLPNIYAYLKEMGYANEQEWVVAQLARATDPTPIIIQAALDKENSSDLCRGALDTFINVLGAEAGNLALKIMTTGGLYLGGGLPPRLLPLLTDGTFLKSFRQKGRFADLLSQIPVHVILNPKTGLLGAASHVLGEFVD